MVEGGGNEVDEDSMMDAMNWLCRNPKIIGAIEELRAKVEKNLNFRPSRCRVHQQMLDLGSEEAANRSCDSRKARTRSRFESCSNAIIEKLVDGEEDEERVAYLTGEAKEAGKPHFAVLCVHVATEGIRIDGRATDTVRKITIETGVAPRAHGSTFSHVEKPKHLSPPPWVLRQIATYRLCQLSR